VRLATNLASVNGINLGSFDESGNGIISEIRIEAQTTKLLFDLEHLK